MKKSCRGHAHRAPYYLKSGNWKAVEVLCGANIFMLMVWLPKTQNNGSWSNTVTAHWFEYKPYLRIIINNLTQEVGSHDHFVARIIVPKYLFEKYYITFIRIPYLWPDFLKKAILIEFLSWAYYDISYYMPIAITSTGPSHEFSGIRLVGLDLDPEA